MTAFYVDDKETLLKRAVSHALAESPEKDETFRSTGLAQVGSALAAKLTATIRWPALADAVARERVSPDTLAAIADELFTLVGRHRQLIWLLDSCASEVGLGGIYETAVRRRLIDDFTSAIGIVLSGRNRSKEEISARARALFEMV